MSKKVKPRQMAVEGRSVILDSVRHYHGGPHKDKRDRRNKEQKSVRMYVQENYLK